LSDIPRARELLQEIESMTDLSQIKRQVRRAIGLMTRERAVRRAPSRPTIITLATRKYIRKLAGTDHTLHEIANLTGIYNIGRISEVLNGHR
jgi:hypothetical protein